MLLWLHIINIMVYPCTVNPVLRNVTMKDWGLRGIIATDGGAFKQLLTTHAYYTFIACCCCRMY